jgi:uncharacterized membrane protein YbhN (UPF0104 family)
VPDLGLVALALAALASVEVAKALRWRALFGSPRPPIVPCLRALVAGQLTNALAPVRAGEVVRLGLVGAAGQSVVSATAALAGAKAIDALCLAAIASAVVGTLVAGSVAVPPAIALAVLLAGVALAGWGSRLRAPLERIPLARRLRLVGLLDAAQALRDPASLLTVTGATLVVWACGLGANWLVLAAVGVAPSLDLAARVLVAGYLVGFLPAPPGRLGVFEAGVAGALISGGVGFPEAASASITLHLCLLAELAVLMLLSLAFSRRASLVRSRSA